MADYNRNRQDAYRQQFDWNEDYHRPQGSYEEEPNYTISENRGYRAGGRQSGMRSGDSGWQSRHEREINSSREGDFNQGHQRPFSRYDENDFGYDRGQRGLSSAYSDFGGDYSGSRTRNLYDRGDQGMGRRDYENTENRIGGANYNRYGDHGRYEQGTNYGRGYGSSGMSSGRSDYGRSSYGRQGSDYDDRNYGRSDYRGRDYGRGESEDRSWWDRTTDEVSSWFGDEDAERRRERDRRMGHRGRGPRNYTRSDERIKEDINDRLSDDPFIDASDIDVSVNSGEAVLSGTVDHRSTKRRAEDLVDSVSGVKNVENRLRVSQSSESTAMNTPSGETSSQSSSPIPGSERGRTRETSKST